MVPADHRIGPTIDKMSSDKTKITNAPYVYTPAIPHAPCSHARNQHAHLSCPLSTTQINFFCAHFCLFYEYVPRSYMPISWCR